MPDPSHSRDFDLRAFRVMQELAQLREALETVCPILEEPDPLACLEQLAPHVDALTLTLLRLRHHAEQERSSEEPPA